MNDDDRNNIEFIMGLNDDQAHEWASNLSADDHAYALEIIGARLDELYEQLTEVELADMSEYTEAEAVIRSINK